MNIDLRANPFFLTEEDCDWVHETIAAMNDEEKVGQLFFQLTSSQKEEDLIELIQTYHLGGCRYNPAPAREVWKQNRILQENSKIPLFIACNTESGGDGACTDGTYIGNGMKIGATGNHDYAEDMGRMGNAEAAAIGCNMAFAPVCDIYYNPMNTEISTRAFSNDPEMVKKCSVEYVRGAHQNTDFACVAKHFPGNGVDYRDAHLSNHVNDFSPKHWDETYGMVYKELIENGVEGIMGGHIMLPEYVRELAPKLPEEEVWMPATLNKTLMTTLLRDKLGFQGVVVTDASHMVAMTNQMTRKEMLPRAINAGCDMFLFFNDPQEDFRTMLTAYQRGVISEERMTEALTRILGIKARLQLHKKSAAEMVPEKDTLDRVLGNEEFKKKQSEISEKSLTLVKYKDKDVLPISPEKYKKVMIVHIKGHETGMVELLKLCGMEGKNPAETVKQKLCERGYDAYVYESPLDQMKQKALKGEKPDLNIYFSGKNAISEFREQADLVITLCDVMAGRPSFGMSKGGGEVPWYVFEVPVIAVGCGQPTMLSDIPQVRTYINIYDAKENTLEKLIEALSSGADAFVGKDPIDSFCGLQDTK